MWKLLNFKFDKRTAWNITKFPFIICLRVPVTCFLIIVYWINDWSDIISDKLPGWDT